MSSSVPSTSDIVGTGETSIDLRTRIPASPARACRSFTDAGHLRAFLAPGAVVETCRVSPEAGGELVAIARTPAGDRLHIQARFTDVVPGKRLHMSWRDQLTAPGLLDQSVLVEFETAGDEQTHVRIRHERLMPGASVKAARAAWSMRLEVLEKLHAIEGVDRQIAALKSAAVEMRKSLPEMHVADAVLRDASGADVRLSEAFGDKSEMLLIHNMGRACVYCTLWADGLSGLADHLADRAALVLVSPDEPAVMAAFAASRGWRFRTLSSHGPDQGSRLSAELGFEPEPGRHWPGVSSLVKDQTGSIRRVASSHFGPGDNYCALWPLLDLLAKGANNWEPKYDYR